MRNPNESANSTPADRGIRLETGNPPGYSRRRFLVSSGWLAAGATVVFSTGCSLPVLPTTSGNPEENAAAWVQVLPDSRIRFFMGKAEMGQGVMTGLTQIVAEDLNVPLGSIEVVLPSTAQIPPIKMTVGSETIQELYLPLRQACTRLRAALKKRAASRSGVPIDGLARIEGGFREKESGREWPYAEIVKGGAVIEASEDWAPLKPSGSFRQIGRSLPRVDIPAKVTGAARYSSDVQLPGMLHGVVARPPAFGAYMESVDNASLAKARRVPGVVEVVEDISENFLGVVADSEENARKALAEIQPRWEIPKLWQQDEINALLDIALLKSSGESSHSLVSTGDAVRAAGKAPTSADRSFTTPLGAHAQMETFAAVAYHKGDSMDLYVSSQDTFYNGARAAQVAGLSKDQVTVHPSFLGGGFGGKIGVEAAFEAARLSTAVRRPVRVAWSREEQFAHAYFRPPTAHRIRAGVSATGRISHWNHEFASGPVIFGPVSASPLLKWVTSFLQDFGGSRGAVHSYDIAHQEIRYWDQPMPVSTGPWRGLGASANAFAIESMMDDLAALAGTDPLEFRLRHLKPGGTDGSTDSETGERRRRLARVLKAAGKKAGWSRPLAKEPPGLRRGRGLACGIYKDQTHVAVVVEVALNGKEKTIRVERMVCAQDCGMIVNPGAVEAQVEGNLVWGLGMALKEKAEVRDGRVSVSNFHQYFPPRMDEVPDLETVLIHNPGDPPTGVGEPAIMPVPAAIANAVFSASGKRVTHLPILPGDVFG
jgi:CO/xanthine dehydrogenase Mo-binding subunit